MNTDDDQVTRGGQASQAGYDGHDTLGKTQKSNFESVVWSCFVMFLILSVFLWSNYS